MLKCETYSATSWKFPRRHTQINNGLNLSSKLSLQNDLVDGSKLEISKNSILSFVSHHHPILRRCLFILIFSLSTAPSDSSLMLLRGWKRNWDVNDDVSTKKLSQFSNWNVMLLRLSFFDSHRSIWRLLSLNFLIKGMKFFHSLSLMSSVEFIMRFLLIFLVGKFLDFFFIKK